MDTVNLFASMFEHTPHREVLFGTEKPPLDRSLNRSLTIDSKSKCLGLQDISLDRCLQFSPTTRLRWPSHPANWQALSPTSPCAMGPSERVQIGQRNAKFKEIQLKKSKQRLLFFHGHKKSLNCQGKRKTAYKGIFNSVTDVPIATCANAQLSIP